MTWCRLADGWTCWVRNAILLAYSQSHFELGVLTILITLSKRRMWMSAYTTSNDVYEICRYRLRIKAAFQDFLAHGDVHCQLITNLQDFPEQTFKRSLNSLRVPKICKEIHLDFWRKGGQRSTRGVLQWPHRLGRFWSLWLCARGR